MTSTVPPSGPTPEASTITATADPAEAPTPMPAPGSSGRYRVVWRWHFYAGLFTAPVLLVLAITGAIYLFKEPFENWRYADVRTLSAPVATALPLSTQIQAALAARPGSTLDGVIPPQAPDRTTRVVMAAGDPSNPFAQGISVYVHPGTGEVLGQIDDSATFMRVVRTVHGELMAGVTGDRIVETAACWALILVVTGAYLWWRGPARRRLPRSAWRPLKRGRLRRVHAVTGAVAGVVLVFLVLSGLPWSGFWGDNLSRLQASIGSTSPDAAAFARESVPAKELTANPDTAVPWAAERLPVPADPGGGGGHGAHGSGTAGRGWSYPGSITAERALAAAAPEAGGCRQPGCELSVLPPAGPKGVYTVVATDVEDPALGRTVLVDQYSGKVLVDYGWEEYGLLAKAVEQGIAVHEGRRFGTANLLVMLGTCVALITLVVSGAWMWWKRRPRGRLAAPARTTDRRTAYGVLAVLAVLGVVFPLAGITMVAVLSLDRLVIRRIPKLNTLIG
ncbi:PepSY domain-containing protein [Spongiactinospora sp. TRM90649]|uniref:PepSY-associated TM helix domain-containing protein n=1 Tax=Spongiactinospora sp. TRM90649 TaxID=3031114 RepID=UPI0023F793DF|nr:PepSY domain-containing protein [Spongiactinospora sp. TRM90649]MDF5752810.1 PepSY domain-containing protein [Spongiactinospora sp. TRM90649]